MAILFLDFFGSDPSKMDQTRKFGEQTSRILEFLVINKLTGELTAIKVKK